MLALIVRCTMDAHAALSKAKEVIALVAIAV